MSRAQPTPNDVEYGVREFDLSVARDDQLVQLPNIRSLAVLTSDVDATVRLGDNDNAPISTKELSSIDFKDRRIDRLYLSNSAGSSGDVLRLLLGRQGIVLDTVSPDEVDVIDRSGRSIGDVNVTDRSGRELGKARLEDASGALIDPAPATGATSLTAFTHTTAGTTAEQLASNAVDGAGSVLVQADDGNTSELFVGNGTNQAHRLDPGESVSLAVANTDAVHVRAVTTGDAVNVTAEA